MSITRLSGGLTPGDGLDPRTFPEIFNGFADEFEEVQTRGFRFVETVTFTSNGTFSKGDYPWLRAIRVKCQGGGGGGGGAGTTGFGEFAFGGNGAGGAYSESFITDISALAASIGVTRGAGGGGGVGTAQGSNGGQSSFGGLVTAAGGGRGLGAPSNAAPGAQQFSAVPGTVGVGDIVIPGGGTTRQFVSIATLAQSGLGGSSHLGNPFRSNNSGSGVDGVDGQNFGVGGSGGANAQNQGTTRTGGSGGNGIVIVELFA